MDHEHCDVASENQCLKETQIVSVTSVPPVKITEPQQVRRILFNDETDNQKIHAIRKIQGCYHIVLYFENDEEEHHDWSLTSWIVESLARTLLDHPLLAGRIHKRNDATGFEIVSNDSGIRLLEARCSTTLSEFLELNRKKRDDHEIELVFWNEIDTQFPQFSPLFYVQVTSFISGGYSIGISCSLFLAEFVVVKKFLNKWAQTYNMLPSISNKEIDRTIFNYLGSKNPNFLSTEDLNNHSQNKNRVQSVGFKITTKDVNFSKVLWRELAMVCMEEAEEKLEMKIGSSFSLVVKEFLEVVEVESVTKSGIKNQIVCITSWDDFGVDKVVFHEENKVVHVSCWIGSVADAVVMILPCIEENVCGVIVVAPS
ncbi:unnamed protein product [Lathyrus sativus]|nr:unnamed protein product [Lathyrus sativus]